MSLMMNKYLILLASIFTIPASWALGLSTGDMSGSVSFEKFHRLNNPGYQNNFNEWAGVSLRGEGDLRHMRGTLDADMRFFFNESNDINYSVSEASLEYTDSERRFVVGRRPLDWNINEHYWMLGNMNAQQGMQLLSEKQEGLVGLYAERKFDKHFKLSLFFSYLYIPPLNPGIDVKDGKITSNSEWVRRPPEFTVIEGKRVPIVYAINMPKVSEIVFKKSLGIRQAYAWDGGEISSFIIYKPENKIRANADAVLGQNDAGDYQINVTANPIVNHHMIYGVQVRQDFGDVKTVTGLDITDPNARLGKDFEIIDPVKMKESNRTFSSDYFSIAPAYDRESYFHSTAYIDRTNYDILFSYIQLLSDNKRGNDDFYSDAVKWKQAFGGKIRYFITDNFNVAADLKYDIARKDNILKLETQYRFAPQADLKVGAELFKSPQENSYWSAYRAHDTIYTQLRFLF